MNKSNILYDKKNKTFGAFIALLRMKNYAQADAIEVVSKQTERYLNSNGDKRFENQHLQKLQQLWYESLERNDPDYSVYDAQLYLAEVWACWNVYSRQILKRLNNERYVNPNGLLKDLNPATVIDLGNGIGLTTTALKQILPNADVYGTNIENSYQWHIAKTYSRSYGWSLVSEIPQINADLVFASEYFEHFEKPLEHLDNVIQRCKPITLVTANAFGTKAIGHFDNYSVSNKWICASKMEKLFCDRLEQHGYRQEKYGFWNNRPKVFHKK